jgi:Ion channel
VGYGDVTVEKDNVWFGAAYMMVSVCVSILAFSAAASSAFSPLEKFYEKYLSLFGDDQVDGDEDLVTQLRRIQLWKIGEILANFVGLNMIGIIASRFFKGNLSGIHEGSEWTWGESVYWSVQSTTTIGYGDMTMSPEMKLFQVFYLCLGTFFVGNTLGKLARLKAVMETIRTEYAWEDREISNEMIRADQGSSTDTRVDQYEFVVASLLNLGKIQQQDVQFIMNKFRKLAKASGDEGYICLEGTTAAAKNVSTK